MIDAELEYSRAIEARNNARFSLRSGLPGRVIYFKASMRRAIAKWRNYKTLVRTQK
jgi:hypothetical protein